MTNSERHAVRIRHATLIDGVSPTPQYDAVLDIDSAGVIEYVGPEFGAPAPAPDADVLDASGLTLLPGLFDCHVHLGLPSDRSIIQEAVMTDPVTRTLETAERLRRALLTGITSARDLGGLPAAFKKAVDSGLVAGPRLQVSVGIISHTGGHADTTMPGGIDLGLDYCHLADDADEARKAVRLLVRDGADLIKICTSGGMASAGDDPDDEDLLPAEVAAIVDEAERHGGRTVASHAQGRAGIRTALLAGVRSIEHGYGIDDECCDLMGERGAYLVPTLSTMFRQLDRTAMPEWHYQKKLRWQERTKENIAHAIDRGIRIAMGTDAGSAPHGQSLAELSHLVHLGMSPMDAIQAATATSAGLLGVDDALGTLQAGKAADLVAVAHDPLRDVGVLRDPENIVLVIKDGRVFKNDLLSSPQSRHSGAQSHHATVLGAENEKREEVR